MGARDCAGSAAALEMAADSAGLLCRNMRISMASEGGAESGRRYGMAGYWHTWKWGD